MRIEGNVKPMPSPTLPRYRWPSERTKTPTHCGHCGGRLIASDIPTADQPITDVACWACSRVACELVSDHTRSLYDRERLRAELAAPPKIGRPPKGLPV